MSVQWQKDNCVNISTKAWRDISLRTINNISADSKALCPSAKWPHSFHRNSYQQHLCNHIHLKMSRVRQSDWRTSAAADRTFFVQPNSRQPAHKMTIILFNSRDGAVQDLFRDKAAKLSSLGTSSTSQSGRHVACSCTNSSSIRLLSSRLCLQVKCCLQVIGNSCYHEFNRPLNSFLLKYNIHNVLCMLSVNFFI